MAETSAATVSPLKKFPFHWGLCPGRIANDVICRASAPELTPPRLHDGNQYRGLESWRT